MVSFTRMAKRVPISSLLSNDEDSADRCSTGGCEKGPMHAIAQPERAVGKRQVENELEKRTGGANETANNGIVTSLTTTVNVEKSLSHLVNDRNSCSSMVLIAQQSPALPGWSVESSAFLSPHHAPSPSLVLSGRAPRHGKNYSKEFRNSESNIRRFCTRIYSQDEDAEMMGSNDYNHISALKRLHTSSEDGWEGPALGVSPCSSLDNGERGTAFLFSFPTFAAQGGAPSPVTPRQPCGFSCKEISAVGDVRNCDFRFGGAVQRFMREGRDICSKLKKNVYTDEEERDGTPLGPHIQVPHEKEESIFDLIPMWHTTTPPPLQMQMHIEMIENGAGVDEAQHSDGSASLALSEDIPAGVVSRVSLASNGKEEMHSPCGSVRSPVVQCEDGELMTQIGDEGFCRPGDIPKREDNSYKEITGGYGEESRRSAITAGTGATMPFSLPVGFQGSSASVLEANRNNNNNNNAENLPLEPNMEHSIRNMSLSSPPSSMGAMAFASHSHMGSQGGYCSLMLPRVLPFSVSCSPTREEPQQQLCHLSEMHTNICLARVQFNTNEAGTTHLGNSLSVSQVNEASPATAAPSSAAMHDRSIAMSESLDALFNVVDVPMELRMRPERLLDAARPSMPLIGPTVLVSNPMNFTIHSDAFPSTSMHDGSLNNNNNSYGNRNNTPDDVDCSVGGGVTKKGYPCRFSGHFSAPAAASTTNMDGASSGCCLHGSALHSFHCRASHGIREVSVTTTPNHDRTGVQMHGDSLKRDGSQLLWSPLRNADGLALSSNPLEVVIRCGGSVPRNATTDGGGVAVSKEAHSYSSGTCTGSSCTRRTVNGPVVLSCCSFRLPTFGCSSTGK